jgi:hypothetical protein
MIIRRKHTGNFAVIPNSTTHDARLSADALGVLVYLLSKPSDWLVHMTELRKRFGMGRDRLYNIIAELESCGYVLRSQNRADSSKRFCPVEYIIHDVPVGAAEPLPENPEAEKPQQKAASVFTASGSAVSGKSGHILKTDLTKSPYGEADASREGGAKAPSTSSQIWTEALKLLSHEPLSESQKRTLIGKWQKRTPTELAKKELLAAVRAAAKAGTPEPISYVEAALRKYPVPPDPVTFTPTDWQRNVQAAIKTKQWAQNWGPPPGKRGCRVPPELVTPQLQSALSQGMRA